MGPRKRQSDDSDRQTNSREEVSKRQPPSSEEKPNEIAEDAKGTRPNRRSTRIFLPVYGRVSERQESIESNIGSGSRPRDADNGHGHDDSCEQPAGGHP